MSNKKELEELLLFGELDSDEELVVLDALNDLEQNQHLERLNIDLLSNDECKKLFRFHKTDLERLRHALSIPDTVMGYNRIRATGLEAMCILLRRLAYPSRYVDLARLFGRTKSDIAILFSTVLHHIYQRHVHLLTELRQPLLHPLQLDSYATAITNKDAPLSNCWGFIDGTVRPIARPTKHQKVVYSGHKRVHALKFQSVMLPNGIIANLYGPMEGRRHDCAMLGESHLLEHMEQYMNKDNGDPFCLYGDPAYPLRPHLVSPYKGINLTREQQEFNKKMSTVRVCVEWGFGKLVNEFAYLDFKKNLKLLLQPVGIYYIVGAILTNCHTCLYSSQTSEFFGCQPPMLESYLGSV